MKCLEFNRYNTFANAALAKLYCKVDDLESAIDFMERQLEVNPYDYRNANNLGLYYASAGYIGQSIFSWRKAIEIKR